MPRRSASCKVDAFRPILRRDGDDNGAAGLQKITVLRQRFGKQHCLELAGRIGKLDDAHLVAGARLAFLLGSDGAGKPPGRRAALHRI